MLKNFYGLNRMLKSTAMKMVSQRKHHELAKVK